MKLNPFIAEYRTLGDDGDPWGECVSWAIALCDHLLLQGLIPDKFWEYMQSPCGPDTDDIYFKIIGSMLENDCTIDELKYFDRILQRYCAALKKADLNY